MNKDKIIWLIVKIVIVLITISVFTPLVTPYRDSTPELFGMPYTLWVGMLVYVLLVSLIIIGINVHSKIFKEINND